MARPSELMCASRFLKDATTKQSLDNPTSDSLQSTIVQIGKTMIWLKMFDQQTKLVPKETDPVELRGIGEGASILGSTENKQGTLAAEVSPFD